MPGVEQGEFFVRYAATCAVRKRLRGLGEDALIPTLQVIADYYSGDWQVQRATMLSFERTVDSMNLALLPILVSLGTEITEVAIAKDEWPESIKLMTVGSEAFDMHTSQGKKAIRMWGEFLTKKYAWEDYFNEENMVRAFGSAVFIVEGGLVDRRIISHPELLHLLAYQNRNFMLGYGVPPALVDSGTFDFLKIARDHIPALNEFRKKVVEK